MHFWAELLSTLLSEIDLWREDGSQAARTSKCCLCAGHTGWGQHAECTGNWDLSLEQDFLWLCCLYLDGAEMGFIGWQCRWGGGSQSSLWQGLGVFRVMAEGENWSTIPLLCLICQNDLSREEFQQLLHSPVPSACDRQGTAPWGSQVPTPNSLSADLARTRFTPVSVQNKWHWLQEVMALGWDWLGFSPSRGL